VSIHEHSRTQIYRTKSSKYEVKSIGAHFKVKDYKISLSYFWSDNEIRVV